MTIEEALTARLKADAVVSQMATEIGSQIAPKESNPPWVIYTRMSTVREQTKDGPSFAHPRFMFSCWAADMPTAQALSVAVRNSLENFRGNMGGLAVSQIVLEDESNEYDHSILLYRWMLDFRIYYTE